MTYNYDETTLDLLRLTVPDYGFLVSIVKQKNTGKLIDGRHRLKVWEELGGEASGIDLHVNYVETDNPDECNQIINECRRPWTNPEYRAKLVRDLRDMGHSRRAIAAKVGVTPTTVHRDLAKKEPAPGVTHVTPGAGSSATTVGQDGKTYKKPATKEEIKEAIDLKASGKTVSYIANKLGRGVSTVHSWLAKGDMETFKNSIATNQVNNAVFAKPTNQPQQEKEQFTPTGVLSDLTKEFIKKESKEFDKRIELLENAVQLSKQLDKLWRYVQQKHDKHGRPVARLDIEIASKVMIQNGTMVSMAATLGLPDDASYFDTLFAIDALGKKISSCARQAIYLSGQSDTVLP